MSQPKAIRNAAPVVPLTAGEFTPQNQICVSPEAEPSPPDSGWAPRRGPQPLSSGEGIRRATHLRAKVAASPDDLLNPCDLETAKRWESRAFANLPDTIQSIGGELVPSEADHRHGNSMRNTVADPSYITADASKSRLDLAFDAGVLETGLDAAETIEARNSLEKMMAHQMAAMHSSTMKLAAQLTRCIERMDREHHPDLRERANIQGTRLAGAIARMSGSYQSGMTTMQRLRSGGTQRVIVQHVTVSEGGQAVVAGQLETGGPAPRGRSRRRGGRTSK
jgi:hypothetical protein